MAASLNPEQLAVVQHDKGPLRVASVAGSGKTTALIERVAYLVQKRYVDPKTILMITFSKAARDEMCKRISKRLPDQEKIADSVRTFHSLALSIYKSEIAGSTDVEIDITGILWLKTMSAAYRELGIQPEKKALPAFASLVKNDLIRHDDAASRLGFVDPRFEQYADLCSRDATVSGFDVIAAFRLAEQIRTQTGIEHDGANRRFVTFDDMIYEAAMLLSYEEAQARWGARWQYVLQDEAQDENESQGAIAGALCRQHRNYMVVGDPAQAIYSWRGARPEKMLAFEDEWPGAKTVFMYRNYRSGFEIVDLANKVMNAMPASTVITDELGVAVEMTSERGVHAYVGYHEFESPLEEATKIAENVTTHQLDGVRWKDQAVLVRLNAQTRHVEMALAKRRVPYKLVSGSSFFTLREANIIFSYLRLLANRAIDKNLKTALLNPSKALSKKYVEEVVGGRLEGEDWLDTARRGSASLPGRQAERVLEWERFMRGERKLLEHLSALDYTRRLRSKLQLDDHLKREAENEADAPPTQNLDAVCSFASEFLTVAELLDTLDELDTYRKSTARKKDTVVVSTIHKAKGMEWPIVYVPQVMQGAFPHVRAGSSASSEERRLFYVAVTRAKDELWISRPLLDDEQQGTGLSSLIAEIGRAIPDPVHKPGVKTDQVQVGTQMGLRLL